MVTGRRRKILRGYTDLTVLRAGRLWTLYRAFDVESSQWVALRVIPAVGVQAYLLDELELEITAVAVVSAHPGLLTVHRFVRRDDGTATIATELCRESYRDRLRREGPFPAGDVLPAAARAAAGLDAAAGNGIVHGDVGPSKILVSRSGEVVLGGFGLGRLTRATRDAASPVNPHTAPEIFEGGEVSPAADVYGLCSTMYELLTGRPPFQAFDGEEPASLLLRMVGEPTPSLRVAGVPSALADLIGSGLAKDPAQRPATAAELSQELSAIALDEPWYDPVVPLEPPGPSRPEPAGARADSAGAQPDVVDARRSEPGVTVPITLGRNVLAPITAGRGAPPVPPRRLEADDPAGPAGAPSPRPDSGEEDLDDPPAQPGRSPG